MKTGTILELREGFGFIKPDQGRGKLFFHRTVLENAVFSELQAGMAVEYKDEKGDKGLRATIVRPASQKQMRPATQRGKEQQSNNEYRFLNPYNFVRFLDKSRPKDHVLGNCPPPPHDRYIGLTGRITCEVEAVTPLFVSDSHAVQEGSDKHKSYRFFQYNGQPAIPASSLRGMVRSVFEAVTNSCLGVFEKNRRLEYRETSIARFMKAGIVQTLPRNDDPGKILLYTEAKIPAYFNNPDKNLLDLSWKCGEEAFAVVRESKRGNKVTRLSKEKRILRANPDEKIVQGRLKIGGPTVENKRHEAFFYNPTTTALFSWERMEDYNAVLNKQQENDDFKTTVQSQRLSVGDLVYVELERDSKSVRNIASVKVPRFRYRKTIDDLLSPDYEHLHGCTSYISLCLTCRTFGWVADKKSDGQQAYAGRVRFTHGKLTHNTSTLPDITLAILSSPKPTTTLFYLLDQNGKPGDVTYDTPNARLRGRKIYRYHGNQLREKEYTRAPNGDQNRTVCGALDKGSTFTFTLDFENLAEVELGALLWALEFEGDGTMFHRLGYAKPLGFGSVKITVTGLEQLKPENRYISLDSWNDGWDNILSRRKGLKERFTEAMTELYNESEFNQLPPIQDLQALLNDTVQYPIHYPRPIADLNAIEQGKEENFRWFGDNKEPLQLAPNDNGFTIPPQGVGKKEGKKK